MKNEETFSLEMRSKLFETPSRFSDYLTSLLSESQTIMCFCRFWPFLLNYVATLADEVTKLKRAQIGYRTRNEAKLSQNLSRLQTRSRFLIFDLISGSRDTNRSTWYGIKLERSFSSMDEPTKFEISSVDYCSTVFFLVFRFFHPF